MYGVRLARVAQIFGRAFFLKAIFGRGGAIEVICTQIHKACLENDICLVKALLRTIAVQDAKAFQEIQAMLKNELSQDEIDQLFT